MTKTCLLLVSVMCFFVFNAYLQCFTAMFYLIWIKLTKYQALNEVVKLF